MPQTDAPPSPSPSPFRLGFRPPSPESLQSSPPLPSPGTSPESLEDLSLDEPAPASDGWDLDESPEHLDATPSPGSTRDSDGDVPEVLDNEALRDMARAAVAIGGHQAHEYLARTPGQKAVGLYLTDDQDQAGIGDPLARIAARHQGIGKVSPDTQDALAAMTALARLATKQITLGRHAKALDAAGAGTPQPMPAPEDY